MYVLFSLSLLTFFPLFFWYLREEEKEEKEEEEEDVGACDNLLTHPAADLIH